MNAWRFTVPLFLVPAVLLLSGCGSDAAAPPGSPGDSPGSTTAEEAQAAEQAARQLIVLFAPEHGPQPADILSAVRTPGSNPALHSLLRRPTHAERLLQGVPLPAEYAGGKHPRSARALLDRFVVLTYRTVDDAVAARKDLAAHPDVLSVESSPTYSFSIYPNDHYFLPSGFSPPDPPSNYQWGMQALNLPQAWSKVRGNAYIGVVDNGVYCSNGANGPCATHSDLKQNLRPGFSRHFYLGTNGGVLYDDNIDETKFLFNGQYYAGHGTHVAGIIAATPEYGSFTNGSTNSGVAGACWSCSLSILRTSLIDSASISAVNYAIESGMQVLNFSWGSTDSVSCTDQPYQSLCLTLRHARDRDVVIVAASGNDMRSGLRFPASSPDTIAAGGLRDGNSFFDNGYGNGNTCSVGQPGNECGSNFGQQMDGTGQVVAPAKDVVSTFYVGYDWNPNVHCGSSVGPDYINREYGDCTGTSMATPHVAGIVGLMRSVDPLLGRDQIKSALLSTTRQCTNDTRCGAGIPDADQAVQTVLGAGAVNRLTPLFSFYNTAATDHFFTTVPQMALTAAMGTLLPQPGQGSRWYDPIGNPTPGYSSFPIPTCSIGPCYVPPPPAGIASIFTTHVNPIQGGLELAPLYRMSWACANCADVSHVYATTSSEVSGFKGLGYQLDGIEGYVFSPSASQPPGTVKLCRRRDPSRNDYVLFAGRGTNGTDCSATSDETGGNYSNVYGADYIGYVYPLTSPQAVMPAPTIGFSPQYGPIGTSVTITGMSFSPVAANDAVSFNGTPATIVSASTAQLVVTVPNGALTGPISVTVSGSPGVTSTATFTVQPTCTGAMPQMAYVPATAATQRVYAYGIRNATAVSFPTWWIPGNQNDIKWLPGINAGGGTWYVDVQHSQFDPGNPRYGDFATHIYMSNSVYGNVSGVGAIGCAATSWQWVASPSNIAFSPTSGAVGSTVTITGTNFNVTPANNVVKFNGVQATVTSASTTQLVVTVPTGALTGPISVTVLGASTGTSTATFTVQPTCSGSVVPQVYFVAATAATQRVCVSGVQNATMVRFPTWSIPTGQTDLQWLYGTNAGGGTWCVDIPLSQFDPGNPRYGDFATHVYLFNDAFSTVWCGGTQWQWVAPPSNIAFSPASGAVGSTVTITGTNFNATPANNVVKFNGVQATVTSASTTQLVVTVPDGALTGPISVTVLGVSTGTSAATFTVKPTCGSVAPQVLVVPASATTARVYVYGVRNATSVRFPTWWIPGGQTDLQWLYGTNDGGGTWHVDVQHSQFDPGNPRYGDFATHVYLFNDAFSTIWCGGTQWNWAAP